MTRKRMNPETVLAGTEKQTRYWVNQRIKIKLFCISVIVMGILVVLIEIFVFNK